MFFRGKLKCSTWNNQIAVAARISGRRVVGLNTTNRMVRRGQARPLTPRTKGQAGRRPQKTDWTGDSSRLIDFPPGLSNDTAMFVYPKRYQVLVVGGGHAGIEAAMAAARLGCSTLMLTQNLDTIGQMSCNPAVGGLAKGHMVREIDALGGVMGLNTDATGIQFRTLNSNKGPSVRAPRAQCDKKAYQFRMKALVEAEPNLDLLQGNVRRILVEGGVVMGIETNLGLQILAKTVIVTTGTFMRGLLHVGLRNQAGG